MFAMLYHTMKRLAGIFFNLLNILLGGNLPPFGSVSMVVEKEHRFLVLEQQNGTVVFPGGFMRWNERPEQTVIREGQEETGLQLHPLHFIGHYPHITKSLYCMSVITLVYHAEVISGKLRKSIEGQPYWIHEDNLRDKLAASHLAIFEDYLRYREAKLN